MTTATPWWTRAACAGDAPTWDLDARSHHAALPLIAICQNTCPVLDDCRADAETPGRKPYGTVRGGIHYTDNGHPYGHRYNPRDAHPICLNPACDNPTGNRDRRYCSPACRSASEVRHGTDAGATAHRRRGTPLCGPCAGAARRARDQRADSSRDAA